MNESSTVSSRSKNIRSPKTATGLFAKKLTTTTTTTTTSQPDDAKKKPSLVDHFEKDGNNIGATMRNEKIESARSITNGIKQQCEQRRQQAAAATCIMQTALLVRLEAKLLANETECTDLRASVLAKEEECAKVRKLLVEARKRGAPRTIDMTRSMSMPTRLEAPTESPKSILRRQPSSVNLKSVSWGANRLYSTKVTS
jgi:hypothetical protein